jgi:hypothetical protein
MPAMAWSVKFRTFCIYAGHSRWIYPAIGAKKLKDFKALDADRFFRERR